VAFTANGGSDKADSGCPFWLRSLMDINLAYPIVMCWDLAKSRAVTGQLNGNGNGKFASGMGFEKVHLLRVP
jgi:hypothetical protein